MDPTNDPSGTISDRHTSHGLTNSLGVVVGGTQRAVPPEPPGPGVSAITGPIWPYQVTDRHGLLWTMVNEVNAGYYRHNGANSTVLSVPEELRDHDGPLALYIDSPFSDIIDDPDLLDGVLAAKRVEHQPRNVFEWVWEHSRADNLAREVLLELAWSYDIDDSPSTWPGYLHLRFHTVPEGHTFTETDLDPVADAVTELIALEELSIDADAISRWNSDLTRSCPQVTYGFPAYQQWLVSHEVPW